MHPSFPKKGILLNSAFGNVTGLRAALPHGQAVSIAPHTYAHP